MMSQGREGKGRGQGVDAAACRRGVAPAGTLAAAVAARGGARRVCWEPGGGGGSAVRRGGGGGEGGGMRHRPRLGRVPRVAADTAPAAAAATAGARAWTGPPLPPRLAPPRRVAARRVGMVGPLLVLFLFCLCVGVWWPCCRGGPHGLPPLSPTVELCAAASIPTRRVVPTLPRAGARRLLPTPSAGAPWRTRGHDNGWARASQVSPQSAKSEGSSGSAGQDASWQQLQGPRRARETREGMAANAGKRGRRVHRTKNENSQTRDRRRLPPRHHRAALQPAPYSNPGWPASQAAAARL